MKIRSIDALEDELKHSLTNPHTSSNMKNSVMIAEKILEVKKNSNYAANFFSLVGVFLSDRQCG